MMPSQRPSGSLFVNIQNHIATVEFGHPASNSLPSELLNRMTDAFKTLSEDDSVRIILLKSEGTKAFCAGASFDELLEIKNLTDGHAFFNGFARLINAIRKCNKPVIGRVQGKAVGGGVGLIAACDQVFATEAAAIKLSEIQIGIGPFVIEPAVSIKIGTAAFGSLAWNPTEWHSAYWAKDNGLYNKIFESIKDMDHELDFFCNQLAQYNPQALSNLKKIQWQGTEHWDTLLEERAHLSGTLVLSEFTKTALKKFKS
jgi:methylglutaconyl-CoA hydratase